MTTDLLTKAGMCKEGEHAHPGAPEPHDIRVAHTGFGGDSGDPLHDEEVKAYVAVKKAEDAVNEAVRSLQTDRRTITASPENRYKAEKKLKQARMVYGEAREKLEEVGSRRLEQLRNLIQTLDLAGPQSPGAAVASSNRQPKAPTPPRAGGKQPPSAAQELGQGARRAAGGVAGHYKNVLTGTSYADKAEVQKHGDHSGSYFGKEEEAPMVDKDFVEKHDTPNSPHSQHANPDGSDPNELFQRRQSTDPAFAEEAPEWLEDENRQRARRGFNPGNEPTGPRPMTPYAAAKKLALQAATTPVRLMARAFNKDGMFDGYTDETKALVAKHKDSSGSTEHHGSREGRKRGHANIRDFKEEIRDIDTKKLLAFLDNKELSETARKVIGTELRGRGYGGAYGMVPSDSPSSAREVERHGPDDPKYGKEIQERMRTGDQPKTNRALSLARTIRRSLTSGVDNFREQVELDEGGTVPTKDVKGVRDEGKDVWPEPAELDGKRAVVTEPQKVEKGPLSKAREIRRSLER